MKRELAAATSADSRASRSIRSSAQPARRGYGKFYTYTDTANTTPAPDFKPGGGRHTHDTVLLEWTAKNPAAATYDGGAPRELMRFEQPFGNHNGGQLALQPARGARAAPTSACCTWASPTAAAAATRSTWRRTSLGIRQDAAHRSARHEQRKRQVRHSGSQPVRQRQRPRHAGEIYA